MQNADNVDKVKNIFECVGNWSVISSILRYTRRAIKGSIEQYHIPDDFSKIVEPVISETFSEFRDRFIIYYYTGIVRIILYFFPFLLQNLHIKFSCSQKPDIHLLSLTLSVYENKCTITIVGSNLYKHRFEAISDTLEKFLIKNTITFTKNNIPVKYVVKEKKLNRFYREGYKIMELNNDDEFKLKQGSEKYILDSIVIELPPPIKLSLKLLEIF